MSERYVKNDDGMYVPKNKLSLNSVTIIAFLIAVIFQLAALGTTVVVRGELGKILQRVVSLDVQNSIIRALESARNVMILITLILIVVMIIRLIFEVRKASSIGFYFANNKLKKAITQALVDTLAVNRMMEQKEIKVPDVDVMTKADRVEVEIEKLAGMYELENLKSDVSSSFDGKYSNYVVTTARVSDNQNKYILVLEDVGTDKTFIPKSLEDLKIGDYRVKLQQDLVINLEERPHVAIFGKTGSKKTTTLEVILLQLALSNSVVYAIDGKDELRSLGFMFKRYASETEEILELMKKLIVVLNNRQKKKDKKVTEMGKRGLKASECGFKPIIIVTDEVSAVLAAMDKKEQAEFTNGMTQIVMKGRSLGIYWILANQDPSTNVFSQAIRSQFATKILLGNANQDIQKMALGEVATIGDIEDFRGYYVSDGLTKQAQKFYVPNIYENKLNTIKAFKKAVQMKGGEKYARV